MPCGGHGTRMRAITGGAPKEMLSVRGIPLVEWAARECAASGITELLVVTAPGKESIEAHLAPLAGTPGMPARIVFAWQSDARGLADAVRLGRDFAAGGPLCVALADNLFVGGPPAVAQTIETFASARTNVVAVVEIDAEDAARRGATGVVTGTLVGETEFRFARIPDKGEHGATFDTAGARAAFTNVGRFAFGPELFEVIDEVERTLAPGAELDDVPVLQWMLARGRLVGRRIVGRFVDAGLPEGYREARELLESPASGAGRASGGAPPPGS
ncbi:MAG TPA: sugar phosphate nucleotidyltransferase [Gemmatimonadaceae bacterium]|nr:sugar phosphate nucleotidyltransferase [Gemmatimonadaceae bacterium]